MSTKSLKRLVQLLAVVLLVATPLLVVGYLLDQHTDAGPTLAERKLVEAEAAVRQHPDDVGLRLALAAAYRVNGREQDALAQYEEVIGAQSDNVAALLGKGAVLELRGDLDAASSAYRRVISLRKDGEFAQVDTDLARAYLGEGVIAVRQERYEDAVAALERAVVINRTDADAWYQLGLANSGAGSPAQAVAAHREAVRFVPTEWAEPYAAMAAAYEELGRTDEAAWATAMVAIVEGRYAAAVDTLTPLVDGPAALDVAVALGLAEEKAGDQAAAAGWYRQALDMDPGSQAAAWGLSRLGVADAGPAAMPSEQPSSEGG